MTFKVGPLGTHTLAPSIVPLLEAPAEGFFWNLSEFGRCIRFYVLHGCETRPLEAHFQSRKQPKVTRCEIRWVRWLGDDRNYFLGEELLHNKQNVAWFVIVMETPLSLPLVAPFPPNCIAQAFLSSPNHRTLRISLRVTFGCSLLWKWASRGRVSQPWRTSNRMRQLNSGRFQKKPFAGASNNGRIDGARVCVCKGPTLKVIR